MSGDVSLGYWSTETSHLSSHYYSDNGIYDDESFGVSVGEERSGLRSPETSQSSSCNSGVYPCGDRSGDDCRYGYRSQDIRHYSSCNTEARVDVDGIYAYMYQNIHYCSHKPGSYGRFLGL